MPTFVTPQPIAAAVEVAGAQVRVTATDRTDTRVLVEPIDPANRKHVKVAENTKIEYADGELQVKTKTAGDKSGSVTITIDLPTGSGLVAHLAFSELHTEGSLGASELHLASGRVDLDHVGSLKASLASGQVAIGHIAGHAEIDGAAFGMRIGEIAGTVGISSAGGQTWIGHASGDLELNSASGDFAIDRADGSVNASTASGAIRIGRMTNGQAKLKNASGNIEVGISEGTAVSVDADSERGAVHNFVLSHAKPGPADARVSLYARTRHGDVTIQRAAS
ncbi:DUF4097 family beta strand repeat-containing protein [Kribbella deserti]|uniref:DUF4097 domain-containing protein n=1 Tax=Kribbella deserti TaxID=1926257 RepID=A0ABV6QEN4_9ACTN